MHPAAPPSYLMYTSNGRPVFYPWGIALRYEPGRVKPQRIKARRGAVVFSVVIWATDTRPQHLAGPN